MDLIALLELDEPLNLRLLTADRKPAPQLAPVVRVHAAARQDADAPGRLTVCGLPAHRMPSADWHPADQDPWWPPLWQRRVCPVCDTRLTGPPSTEPGGQDDRPHGADGAQGAQGAHGADGPEPLPLEPAPTAPAPD